MSEGAFLCEQRPDLITPARIEHLLDEFTHEGECFARYNYLDYFFENPDCFMRGRVYLHDASEMTLFGPFAREVLLREVEDPALEAAVMDYARRRFPTVKKGGEA